MKADNQDDATQAGWHVFNGFLYRGKKAYAAMLHADLDTLMDLAAILNVERSTIEAYEAADASEHTTLSRLRAALETFFRDGGIGVDGTGHTFIRDEDALVNALVPLAEALAESTNDPQEVK